MVSDQEKAQTRMNQAGSASQAALQEAVETNLQVQLLEVLRRPDVDTEADQWLSEELGPNLSGAHAVANKGDNAYEKEDLLDRNKADRIIAEKEHGRLCVGKTKEVAYQTHKRPDKSSSVPLTVDEKRKLRQAVEAGTALKSLGEDAAGLEAVTTARAEAEVEVEDDASSDSRFGGLGEVLG